MIFMSIAGVNAKSFSSLEEMMTAKEFNQAGLNNLSEEELKQLNSWLLTRNKFPELNSKSSSNGANLTDKSSISDMPKVTVVSRIIGEFSGWDGKTIFKLENGQTWQQTEDKLFYVKEVNPAITIKPKSFGTWVLKLDDFGHSVRVKRIK